MSLRLATFNVENLMTRFDFTGFRNQLRQDRVIQLFEVRSEGVYQQLEQARVIAATDDTRQMTALAIAETCAASPAAIWSMRIMCGCAANSACRNWPSES